MIFFTENIKPFNASNGMKITPYPCKLIDGRIGYCADDFWSVELEAKGAIIEQITKEEIDVEVMPIINEEV